MAINKKLIHFKTLAAFEAQMSAGNILDTSIVFIKDAKKIWTHGEFYDCDQINLIETTYLELKEIKDVGNLIPGMQYRITDYVSRFNTKFQSANHPFDIIVTAVDEHTFNENAKAVQHEGDTYFETSNLNAWEIKYQFDNTPYSTSKNCWWMPGDAQPEIIESENAGILTPDGTVEIDGEIYYKYIPSTYDYLRTCKFYRFAGETVIVDPGYENVVYVTTESPEDTDELVMYIMNKHSGEIYDRGTSYEWWGEGWDDYDNLYYNVGFGTNNGYALDMNWWSGEIIVINETTYYVWYPYSSDKEESKNQLEWTYTDIFPMEIRDIDIYTGDVESLYYINTVPVSEDETYYIEHVTDGNVIYQSNDWWDTITDYQSAVSEQRAGKGGIYYMKDDRGNEMPVDFKNALISGKYIITTGTSDATLSTAWNNKIGSIEQGSLLISGTITVGSGKSFKHNIISVISGTNTFEGNTYNNTIGELVGPNSCSGDFYWNTIGNNFSNNTFVGRVSQNIIGNAFKNNVLDDSISSSPLAASVSTFGNNVSNNDFGRVVNCNFGTYIANCKFGYIVGSSILGLIENVSITNSSGEKVHFFRGLNIQSGANNYKLIYDGTISSSSPISNLVIKPNRNFSVDTPPVHEITLPKSTNGEAYTIAVNSEGNPVVYCEADLLKQ